MSNTITARIDVTKIDKARLYQGKKGKYLDVVLIPSNGKYDDTHMVVQSVSKEERDNGVRGNILGNATELFKRDRQQQSQPPAQIERPGIEVDDEDDVPF